MYLKAWCELWASEILVPVTVFILFFDSHGFSLNSSFMAAHSWGSSLYKSLYHVISTVGCTDIICEWKLYFQTVSNPSLHRGHLRGTFVHGLLGVNLCAVAIKSFTALGHWDCWGSTDFALFLPLPFVRQIEQRLPTFKQNPKGLFWMFNHQIMQNVGANMLNKLWRFTDGQWKWWISWATAFLV